MEEDKFAIHAACRDGQSTIVPKLYPIYHMADHFASEQGGSIVECPSQSLLRAHSDVELIC